MSERETVVAGVDVGGARKGFHAVLLRGGRVVGLTHERDPAAVAGWCAAHGAAAVGVDAPCRWSAEGRSRASERALQRDGLHCYYTPTRAGAEGRAFYGWVFNGEALYRALRPRYPLYRDAGRGAPFCFETFPHAVACAREGRVVRANPGKEALRRAALRRCGIDDGALPSVDFVDAALCAVAAGAVLRGAFRRYGDAREGLILVPEWD